MDEPAKWFPDSMDCNESSDEGDPVELNKSLEGRGEVESSIEIGEGENDEGRTGRKSVLTSRMFAEIERNGVLQAIDPRACILLTQPRAISASGLDRLEHSFTSYESTSTFTGYNAAGGKAVVIKLEGVYSHYPKMFLSNTKRLPEAEVNTILAETPDWYGVVDGHHRLLVLQRLIEKRSEQWCGFQWNVLLIPASPIDQLRAYARARNSLQEENFIVKTSVYDVMRALKDDAKTLVREKFEPGLLA